MRIMDLDQYLEKMNTNTEFIWIQNMEADWFVRVFFNVISLNMPLIDCFLIILSTDSMAKDLNIHTISRVLCLYMLFF